jgi:hypothetical protein
MRLNINKPKYGIAVVVYLGGCLCLLPATLTAQDSTGAVVETVAPVKAKPVKKYISKHLDHRQPNCLSARKKNIRNGYSTPIRHC